MIRKFVNREKELALLESLWRRGDFTLVIVYGRRRIGKTRLLKEFSRGKDSVYFLAAEVPYERLCSEFSAVVSDSVGIPLSGDIIDVIAYLSKLGRRILVVLDEFQYIVEADPSFPSRLMRAVDEVLRGGRVMLVLCGSAVSFFERKLLGYRSPLFGRREGSIKLKPLRFPEAWKFFPSFGIEEAVRVYGLVGGTPAYLERLEEAPFEENVRRVLTPGAYLYDEAINLLRQEVREPRTYLSILYAVAAGKNSPSEAASWAKVDPRTVGKYVGVLEELGILRRITPLGFKRPVKLEFADNYFRFWFTYVFRYRSALEAGMVDEVVSHVLRSYDAYISRVFEGVVEELLPDLYRAGVLRTKPLEFGRWWHKGEEIDCVVREPGASTTFVEVKWGRLSEADALRELKKLEAKSTRTGLTSPENFYLLVARELEESRLEFDERRVAVDLRELEKILRGGDIT